MNKQLYFPPSKLDGFEKEFKTIPVDVEGRSIPVDYNENFVRGTVLKLISDVRQLLDENQWLRKETQLLEELRLKDIKDYRDKVEAQAKEIELLKESVESIRDFAKERADINIYCGVIFDYAESVISHIKGGETEC